MVKRFGFVILGLVLSIPGPDLRGETRTGGAAAPIALSGTRPLDAVMSSVSRGLGSLHPPRGGVDAGEERRAAIRRAARDLFDIDEMARRALGRHWKGLLPREQDEFVRLFRSLLTQSFATIVERYTGDDIAFLNERVAGTFAQVRSRITPEHGSEIAIEYRLSGRGSQWMVYDIVVDGMSLISSYRSQFNSLVGVSSVPQLLERMRREQSRHLPSRAPVDGAMSPEPEMARGRLAAGLLLGATLYGRWR